VRRGFLRRFIKLVSSLTLIRHGQAASLGRDEALTSLGETQAAALARCWLGRGTRFDEVFTGTLARQVSTERVAAGSFRQAGAPWPEAVRTAAWNEYDATGVLAHLIAHDHRIAALAADYEAERDTRSFHRLIEAAMTCWIEGAIDNAAVEQWPVFRDRVAGAIRAIMNGPAGRRVAVFTSAGPIGFAVHFSMKAPPRSFLDVNWRIRNCSVTDFVFDSGRFSLDRFNDTAHLDDAILTFR
jgi:broad specificity phosphatase PhoE